MNWDAIGAFAELLGALGVIISLLYLARQVRHSTSANRVQAGEGAIRAIRELLAPIYTDAELATLFAKIFSDFDTLTETERNQGIHLMFQVFKAGESIHYHHVEGMLDNDTWLGWKAIMTHYINTPGFTAYWSLRRDVYSPRYQEWVDQQMGRGEGRIVGSL